MAGFKKNVQDKEENKQYELRLYVTGSSPNSLRSIINIKEICETYLKGRYKLDIIDVYQQEAVASEEQIIALPLRVKKRPLPERRMIGDLSETTKVLKGLDLPSEP